MTAEGPPVDAVAPGVLPEAVRLRIFLYLGVLIVLLRSVLRPAD
jgi:hypothetical protein